jgi:hypothetical protein
VSDGQTREVDPRDHPPDGGAANLLEPGVLEDLTGTHVHFSPGDLLARLGDHRAGLERAGAALGPRRITGSPPCLARSQVGLITGSEAVEEAAEDTAVAAEGGGGQPHGKLPQRRSGHSWKTGS